MTTDTPARNESDTMGSVAINTSEAPSMTVG